MVGRVLQMLLNAFLLREHEVAYLATEQHADSSLRGSVHE